MTNALKKHYTLRWLSLFIVLTGYPVSIWSGWAVYQSELLSATTAFKSIVDNRSTSLSREIQITIESLRELKAVIELSHEDEKTFETYATNLIKRHNHITALEWIPMVNHSGRVLFVEHISSALPSTSFDIKIRNEHGELIKAPTKDYYFPITYIVPFSPNRDRLGFDISSSSKQSKRLHHGIESDSPVIFTGNQLDYIKSKDSKNIFTFLPVYHGDPQSSEKRIEQLSGFVVGIFETQKIFKYSALSMTPSGVNMSLIQYENDDEQTQLHNHLSRTGETTLSDIRYEKSLPLLWGTSWSVVAQPTKAFMDEKLSIAPYLRALFGMFATAFVAYWLFREAKKIKADELYAYRLKQLAETDSLTGLYNRRTLDKKLAREWSRAYRSKQSLSVLIIDIDFFKKYNDHYGHLKGDTCIQQVAQAIESSAKRASDIAARYGGEEFVVILPDTENPTKVGESIMANIKTLAIAHEMSSVSDFVTLSIGSATIVPEQMDAEKTLLLNADQALYFAKENGRNRLVNCNEIPD